MNAVVLENLSKTYPQGKKAVDNVSLTLEQGKVFGFLGPNGAGKTTTVKLLNGMLTPTEGRCRVLDIDPREHPAQVHQYTGVITEHAQMYDHLTGMQNLVFYGAVFGMNSSESRKHAETLLEKLELTDAKDQKLATYSTGMRQRLSLARALIHRPRVLFLDEPTSGLDPESTMNVNNMIKEMAQSEGITVFLCTHQLRYAQEICNAYGLIDDGKMLAKGNLSELRSLVDTGMTVSIATDTFPDRPYKKTGDKKVEIHVDSEDEIPVVIKQIVRQGGNIYQVSPHKLSLEEIYFALLEKQEESGEPNHG